MNVYTYQHSQEGVLGDMRWLLENGASVGAAADDATPLQVACQARQVN